MSLEKEIRGSDEVEHNVLEYILKIETKHTLGKHTMPTSSRKDIGKDNFAL